MAKKKQQVKVEPVEEPEEVAEDNEEEVTCPVCGAPVGIDVLACPSCGAEFEAEELEEIVEEEPVAQPQRAAPAVAVEEEPEAVSEDDMAECPVCGNSVSLNVTSCPYCGAEFEEEEVEEVIEVEEEPVPIPVAKPKARPVAVEEAVQEAADEEYSELERTPVEAPSSIMDLRVIGVSLIVLGIIGSQISFLIDWYWTWVPPIGDNLGMFLGIAAVVVIVGLLVFVLHKRSSAAHGTKKDSAIPGIALSILLFGIFALVMVLFWDPINTALQNQSLGVAIAFIAVIIVGVLAMFMGQKMVTRASAT
ncbi:MAG: hypothetical protein A3K76_01115 [Euryarchaeota archaeon RBG_13_57_23]|nr:MAG: hypothetical protein A3K76_01115 [Euryarchaeota archaeon RBG_13_57_23]